MSSSAGSHVGPGLWSAAEAEVLVVSANIPLMGPIVQRLRAKYRTLSDYSGKDEESNIILDSSETGFSGKGARSRSTPVVTKNAAFDTYAIGRANNSKIAADTVFPDNGILVERNLEQNVNKA